MNNKHCKILNWPRHVFLSVQHSNKAEPAYLSVGHVDDLNVCDADQEVIGHQPRLLGDAVLDDLDMEDGDRGRSQRQMKVGVKENKETKGAKWPHPVKMKLRRPGPPLSFIWWKTAFDTGWLVKYVSFLVLEMVV